MITYLEEEWQEKRNIVTLFPIVDEIAMSNPSVAYKIVKKNEKINNTQLSTIFDAAWWCLYGLLYSNEYDRINAQPHELYFDDENNFRRDAESICKCEMMRVETGVHRYPIPKARRGEDIRKNKKFKLFNEYHDSVLKCTVLLISSEAPEELRGPEVYKMTIDTFRCYQERLIGNDPDSVNETRKNQFIAIGNLLDAVFTHRGYVRKVKEDGAEFLTPEQVDEWENAKTYIKQQCSDSNSIIPGFVTEMINHPSFIMQPVA